MIFQYNQYFKQVELLLRILPIIAEEPDFVLKGGTALNLFIRDMPRLSVDIDLLYQPIEPRDITLKSIDTKLHVISNKIRSRISGSTISFIPPLPHLSRTILCNSYGVQVKIEVNTVIRGVLFPSQVMYSCNSVEKYFKQFVEINVAHKADLYGGKICASLDRQHPRDLFDIKLMLENDGLTEEIKKGFLFYLLSHNRPMSELLNPSALDMKEIFLTEFEDMTDLVFTYEDFIQTRNLLLYKLKRIFNNKEKQFLLSFKKGEPIWELSGLQKVEDYPAIQWKLYNIRQMVPKKRSKALEELHKVLDFYA